MFTPVLFTDLPRTDVKTRFDEALVEHAVEPAALPDTLATHRRNIEGLRGDLAAFGTDVDRTRLGRELHRLGTAASLAGDHAAARAALDEAVVHFERLERPLATWWVRARRAWAIERAGQPRVASTALTALLDEATDVHLKAYGEAVYRWRARAWLAAGDLGAAREDLETAIDIVRDRPRPTGLDALVDALHHLGRSTVR